LHVDIEGPRRRQGLAKYLVAEAMHDLAQEGVSLMETHVATSNIAALKLFDSLGFEKTEYGIMFRRA
jgi:ribosomal protein S18 acetylase RimI-like enzyme